MVKRIFIFLMLLFCLPAFAQTWYTWTYREHATDCTSLTDGKDVDLCFEIDDEKLYKCEPSSGDCDTPGEWKLTDSDTDTQDLSLEGNTLSLTDGGSVDLSGYLDDTDTNANTICSGTTTYLDGEGGCDDISSVYEPAGITESDISDLAHTATAITDDLIVEADLNVDEAPADNDILTYDTTGANFSWQTPAELITAGDNISWSGTTLNVTAHTTDIFKAKIAFEDPTADDDFVSWDYTPAAVTITGIYCETDTGTADIDVNIDDGSASGINGSYITCTSSGVLDSSLAGDTSYAATDKLDLVVDSVASTPGYLTVVVYGTYD